MLTENVLGPTYVPLPTPTIAKASLLLSTISSCVAWWPACRVRLVVTFRLRSHD